MRVADFTQTEQRIEDAIVRVRIQMEHHDGCWPQTSELAAAVGGGGLQRTDVRLAIRRMIAQGDMTERKIGRVNCYFLTYQTPSPLIFHAILLAHTYSCINNAYGSDCHPWRPVTLACPLCAQVRESHPEWRVTADDIDPNKQDDTYIPRNAPKANGQMSLGRRSRTTKGDG